MVVSAIIVGYTSIQFLKLVEHGDTTIMVSKRDNFFETDDEFATEDGL